MPRIARLVLPGVPHHITQRGVRSMQIFRAANDRRLYVSLLRRFARESGVKIWAWCLMTNHVHLVVVPPEGDAIARAIGETHRRYTLHVNQREDVRGHLFQERFHSFPIQTDDHLLAVVRYVERNPVRARLVKRAEDYEWSSARHHVRGTKDLLVTGRAPLEFGGSWRKCLAAKDDGPEHDDIQLHARTGRPWGERSWLEQLEREMKVRILPRKRGWPSGRLRH